MHEWQGSQRAAALAPFNCTASSLRKVVVARMQGQRLVGREHREVCETV
jgi:hypothetical protein